LRPAGQPAGLGRLVNVKWFGGVPEVVFEFSHDSANVGHFTLVYAI